MLECSYSEHAAVTAYRKGYRVDESGNVWSHQDQQLSLNFVGKYLGFGIQDEQINQRRAVRVHQLAAVQKFGIAAFEQTECVRHKNDNPLDNRPANITIGTQADNLQDVPPEERSRKAQKAVQTLGPEGATARGYKAAETRGDAVDWSAVDQDQASGLSFDQLQKKHGVSSSSLNYRYGAVEKPRKNWEQIDQDRRRGLSVSQLAKKHDILYATVYDRYIKRGKAPLR